MNFREYLKESKTKDGMYFVIEMPRKANNYTVKKIGGPFKSFKEAEKAGDGNYGTNQDQVIAIVKNGKLYMPNFETKEATDNALSNILGAKFKNVESMIF